MVKIVGTDTDFAPTGLPSASGASPAGASARSAAVESLPLDALRPGQTATIVDVHAPAHLKMHLMELGFVAGSSITFLMSTPFGDPHIFRLRGTSIALRRSEAQCIRVRI